MVKNYSALRFLRLLPFVILSEAIHASTISGSKNVTVGLEIPPKISAEIFSQGQPSGYTVCVAGRGVGQFRILETGSNLSQDNSRIADYSAVYGLAIDKLDNCTDNPATVVSANQPEADPSIVLIAAE